MIVWTIKEKEEAIRIQDFEKAAKLRDKIKKLDEELDKEKADWNDKKTKKLVSIGEEEIAEKEKEIIKFADIGDFINKPVKTYSSGMYSKLAFAITAILETDIMLIDEVLSVGDAKFKEKSYNKMKELISDETRTVIIVSHSLGTIAELCDEVLWLEKGEVVMKGDASEVIPKYEEFMKK